MNTGRKTSISISIAELKILTLLARNDEGLFGSEFVHLSKGFLARGTIYATLDRLEKKSLIKHSVVAATPDYDRDRQLYKITKRGTQAIERFVEEFGFSWEK